MNNRQINYFMKIFIPKNYELILIAICVLNTQLNWIVNLVTEV